MDAVFDNRQTIKAISLWQPWASLVAAGYKGHETRHWQTAHRGLIAIHAARVLDVAGAPEELCLHVFGPDWRTLLPRGAVVAVSELTSCSSAQEVVQRCMASDVAAGNFSCGRFAWRLDRTRALRDPIPLAGRQGLFNWCAPGDLESLLGPVINHAAVAQSFERLGRAA